MKKHRIDCWAAATVAPVGAPKKMGKPMSLKDKALDT